MRITLLSFEYPAETGFGGIGSYTWFHARALAKLGHDVHVLAGATAPGRLRPDHHDGVKVWRTRGAGSTGVAYRALGRLQWWWTRERVRNALDMRTALRALEADAPCDVIEMPECGAEGALVVHATRTPTVVRLHSPSRLIMPYYDVRRPDMRWSAWLEEHAMSRATVITSTSAFLATQVRDVLGFTQPIEVIPNGIDLDWFDDLATMAPRSSLGLPDGAPLILFAGRMERRKGIEIMPQVAGTILERHEATLALAGDDTFGFVARTLLPSLEGRRLRGTVHALGRLAPPAVRDAMRQANIVLLPSLWESCPYSCLEAMAAGRAIVAFDAGGLPELLRDGENALVVPTGDTEGFIAALDALLTDPALRERLGRAARRTVEQSYRDVDIARRSVTSYQRLAG